MRTPAKLGLLGSLYFSQGLPYGFFIQALPVILHQQGFSLGKIGLSSLLALPWALKFLWAPAIDRFGTRKSWIVSLQLCLVALPVALAISPGTISTTALMGAVLLSNLLAATHDIATDGLAIDLLSPPERGLANGLQVAGYRVGMIAGGGALLIWYDRQGATSTFLAMAALTALAMVPVLLSRSPAAAAPREERPAAPLHFLRRSGAARVLLLVAAYKVGDSFAVAMLRPFLAEAGLGLADIGWMVGTVGFVGALAGALCGGALVNRLGRRNALVIFGLLQTASVAGYAFLAYATPTRAQLTALCAAEHFAGGLATAALFTCMMDWCSPGASATDYTVQASTAVISTGLASALAGFSAEALGYFGHFCLAAVLSAGAVAVVYRCFPASRPAPSLGVAHA